MKKDFSDPLFAYKFTIKYEHIDPDPAWNFYYLTGVYELQSSCDPSSQDFQWPDFPTFLAITGIALYYRFPDSGSWTCGGTAYTDTITLTMAGDPGLDYSSLAHDSADGVYWLPVLDSLTEQTIKFTVTNTDSIGVQKSSILITLIIACDASSTSLSISPDDAATGFLYN